MVSDCIQVFFSEEFNEVFGYGVTIYFSEGDYEHYTGEADCHVFKKQAEKNMEPPQKFSIRGDKYSETYKWEKMENYFMSIVILIGQLFYWLI